MSFSKAVDLLKLAKMIVVRYSGVSLSEITEEFACDYRTAQRMTRALERVFPGIVTRKDATQRKRWLLQQYDLRLLSAEGLRVEDLVALEMSKQRAQREGVNMDSCALADIRDRLSISMPKPALRRAESDAEAILEALGFACRPGPKIATNDELLSKIMDAFRGPYVVNFTYPNNSGRKVSKRMVEPYGILLGTRKYLVGKILNGDGRFRHFRLDRIVSLEVTKHSFSRDPSFSLQDHAARSFGSFYSDEEFGEVVWRFRPNAAAVARDFVFHPYQEFTEEDDGSLVVRFWSSGHLEMAWHLYGWGDAVEVIKPDRLRELVENHQRGDFQSFP
jgi:predicted DNA-binding transcriptional regulator YafY